MTDEQVEASREKWCNAYADAIRTGDTVTTFDEAEAWRHNRARDRPNAVWATGVLAEQVRSRLVGDVGMPVRFCEAYDLARKQLVVTFDCGIPGVWLKDISFPINFLGTDGLDDIEAVRAWVEGREPMIQADFPRRDEEKRAIRITLAEAFTAAAENAGVDLWQSIEDGICPDRWAWAESGFACPPKGMYAMWKHAVDLILPIIGVDRSEFEDEYHLYYCWGLEPLSAWKNKPREEVQAILRQAIKAAA
ncbi:MULTISPECIES: hypothetical protein [Nocardia]|uniref:hypothetical protein n=1 Tax=Nocardia TaxID=1817 RepID=UPI000D6958D8|nr:MULTISPECIES: hypothetical protein [Nocardia]